MSKLETIDPAAMNNVTGGTVSNSSSTDTLTQSLQQILTSIQQLQQNNQGMFSGQNGQMTMMMMMMLMEERNGGGGGGGYIFSPYGYY